MLEGKVIIAVDFDGTITNERDMGEVMTLKEGAKEVLTEWYETGYVLILWTCRAGDAFEKACDFLVENDMLHLFSALNDQLPEINEKYYPDVARKVGADFYVDDRNLGTVVDWKLFQLQLAINLNRI
jgi:histidinol phosphatase-like enzyme